MVGSQRVGAQTHKKWGPRRVGARTVGAQNFALFFSLSRHIFLFFLPLLLSPFRGILVVFDSAGALKCARLEFSRLSCRKPRWPSTAAGA